MIKIKYRQYDPVIKKYSYFVISDTGISECVSEHESFDKDRKGQKIEMFAGILDKEGKEIYIGDVVEEESFNYSKIGIVKWWSTNQGVGLHTDDGKEIISVVGLDDFKIIGNVNDDKEKYKELIE